MVLLIKWCICKSGKVVEDKIGINLNKNDMEQLVLYSDNYFKTNLNIIILCDRGSITLTSDMWLIKLL